MTTRERMSMAACLTLLAALAVMVSAPNLIWEAVR